jgi:branched-chain amino acid transport system ATP-binding protein
MTAANPGLLEIHGLHVHYGTSHVVQGVDLTLRSDEAVALLGRNGVGKTTFIESLAGLVKASGGHVRLDGEELLGRPPHAIGRAGIALVPQGRRVFAPLTVAENLRIAQFSSAPGRWDLEAVYELLPRLGERRAHRGNQLSGGEQQMLAIGRALMRNPRVLLLDEPSEGLAPMIVSQIAELILQLRASGLPVLVVEQNLGLALRVADRVVVMDRGRFVYDSSVANVERDPSAVHELLGV